MRNLGTMLIALAAVLATACGGTQTGVTEGTGGTTETENPCASATGDNPCAETPASSATGMKAVDATVLAEDGSHVQLASAWLNTTAVIVFYRGHW